MTKVSLKIPTVVVKEIIEDCYYFTFIDDIELEENIYPKIFVNGILLGITKEPENFIKELKDYHKNNLLDKSISFTFNKEENEIKMFSDEGRLLRPVFTVNEDNKLNIKEDMEIEWKKLVEDNYIKYIDNCEVENSVIAMDQNDLQKFKCNYCEIHPSMMMGVMSSSIPFPDHSQSPRNIYQSSMSKQAIGIYATSFQNRADTITYVLNYLQKPLVSTLPSQFMGFNDMPMGMNVIVAVMTYGGWGQEDAVILNKGAIDRGLFHTTSYRTLMTEEKKQGSNNFETICMPPIDKRKKNANYSFLDENGVIKKRINGQNVYVEKGDVIIGKTLTKSNKSSLEEEVSDLSYVIKSGEEGFIDRIFETITPNGYKMVKVVIRNNKIPEIGDKFASFREGVCEALTIDGWKPIEEITLDDKVAILENDNVKYENPTETYCYDYNGKLYELKSQQVELSVTHNHRMWIKKRDNHSNYKKEFEFMIAEKCFGKRLKYKKNINNFEPEDWIGEYFTIPEFSVKMDDWLVFFGIWIAEGWTTKGNSTVIAANKHRVQKAYEKSCKNMGFIIDKEMENDDENTVVRLNGDIVQTGHGYKWSINNKDLTNYMKQFSVGAVDKFLPEWVWSLNKEQCRLLLTSLEFGDGYTSKTNNRFYYTSSKRLCDDITRLALHAGYSTNCRVPEGRKAGTQSIVKDDGRVITSTKDNWVITIIKTKTEPEINHGHKNSQEGQKEEWVDYNGKVYCLSVRTGVFLVRQNGKPVWSGNSRAAQKGTVGMIYRQEDMPFTPDGITPDLILNAHAIPSRMTINVLLETLLGKSCLLEGTFGDATPFTSNSTNIAEKLCDRLQNNGYERHGWEELINGFTGEPIKAKVFIGPTFYQRLKHMVKDKIHCIKISEDTSVLTLNGWKTAYDISMDDYVATLKDGKLIYEKPINIMIYSDYEGPMYYIKNQAIDLAVTGNHRMWVSKPFGPERKWQEYDFARADQIVGKFIRYKKDAIWEKEEHQFILPSVVKFYTPTLDINIKEKIVDMNSWLIFFGIWYAEGWASGGDTCGRINISVNKQRVKDALYSALDKLGYKFSVNKEDKLNLYDYQLYRYMRPLSVGAPNKELPQWVFELSKEQTRVLIKGMLLGDGSSNKNSGCEFYYTSSIKLADQFQQLCLHAGWAGIISTYIKAGENHVKINERDIVNNYDILRISVITKRLNPSVNHGHVHKQKVQEEKYIEKEKCPVFCLQVPSEVFYVRTKGKACWTGNSRANGDVTLLTRQPLRPTIILIIITHPLYLFKD